MSRNIFPQRLIIVFMLIGQA